MKIFIDDKLILEIEEWQLKALSNDINENALLKDLENRATFLIKQKIKNSIEILKREWSGKIDFKTTDKEVCEQIFSRSDYLSMKQKQQKKELKEKEFFKLK